MEKKEAAPSSFSTGCQSLGQKLFGDPNSVNSVQKTETELTEFCQIKSTPGNLIPRERLFPLRIRRAARRFPGFAAPRAACAPALSRGCWPGASRSEDVPKVGIEPQMTRKNADFRIPIRVHPRNLRSFFLLCGLPVHPLRARGRSSLVWGMSGSRARRWFLVGERAAMMLASINRPSSRWRNFRNLAEELFPSGGLFLPRLPALGEAGLLVHAPPSRSSHALCFILPLVARLRDCEIKPAMR